MKPLVVIPTYNERANLEPLVAAVLEQDPRVEALVIDDNSPDSTGRLAAELSQANRRLHVLRRPAKLGLGTAYLAGFRFAAKEKYDRVITMDADFSHDPGAIPPLLALSEEKDVVIGSRYVRGGGTRNWGLRRKLLSGLANFVARRLLGLSARDCTSGFRCYGVSALGQIDLESVSTRGYGALVELLYRLQRAGCSVGEVPITFVDRKHGRSKISWREIIGAARMVFRLRRTEGKLPLDCARGGEPVEPLS